MASRHPRGRRSVRDSRKSESGDRLSARPPDCSSRPHCVPLRPPATAAAVGRALVGARASRAAPACRRAPAAARESG